MRMTVWVVALLLTGVTASQQIEHWTARQEWRIGSVDDSAQALTQVGDVAIAATGRIYIAQPADQLIRVLSGAGELERSIGRSGQGPGEFQMLGSIGMLGDTLYATDHALRRITLFRPNGTVAREFALLTPLIGTQPPQILFPSLPRILLPDGTGLVWPSIAVAWLATRKDRIPLFRLHMDGQVDTIAQAEYEAPNAVLISQGRRIGVAKPFPDSPIYAFLADGSGVVSVHRRAATSRQASTFRVTKISVTGDTLFRRDVPYDPVPFPEALLSEAVVQIHERLAGRGQAPEPDVIRAALREGGHVPRFLVPVTEVASGIDGTLWLKREKTQAPRTEWQILGPDGVLKATVELGRNQSVKAVSGTTVVVTELDSLDVPYIIRYRIVK